MIPLRARRFAPFLLLLVLIVPALPAKSGDAPPPTTHYVAPSEVDFVKVMPAGIVPLTDDQADAERDFELSRVVEIQKMATPEDIQRARNEANTPDHLPSPYAFADVIGPWFKEGNPDCKLAVTLLKNVVDDEEAIIKPAKKHWNRPRPFRQDPDDVKLQTDDPGEVPSRGSASYPSGHAACGMLFALVLSDLAPQLKDKLIARGIQYGDDRVVLGVHFPSDVAAGRALGEAIYAVLKDKKTYQDDLAAAKAPFQKALLAPTAQ